jgi:ribose transport system substrate-binding protein
MRKSDHKLMNVKIRLKGIQAMINWPRIRWVLIGAILTVTAAACSSGSASSTSSSSSSSKSQQQYVVGFSNPTDAQPVLQAFQAALIAAGKNMGIKVVPMDAELNVQTQVSNIEQMVAEHMNGIIVFPLAPDTLNPALNRARAAGIKVLGYNAVIQPPAKGASIAPYDADFDQGEDYQGANLLARYISQQIKGQGNVLGIGIGAPVPSLQFMMQQYQTYLKGAAGGVRWLETASNATDDIAGGQKAAQEAVTKYQGKVNAVMAYNDDSAIGAAIALRDADVKNAVIVGMNGDPQGVAAVQDGQMSAMIDIVPWRQALIGAAMIDHLLTGKSVPSWVATPVEMYTKANIGQRLDWNKAIQEIQNGSLTCDNGGCPASLTAGS